jgi:CheY-like chemotaxis protein
MDPSDTYEIVRDQLSIQDVSQKKKVKEKPSKIFTKKMRGLLIDDQIPLVDLLSKFLGAEGYLTEKVTDGRLALKRLDEALYDFIICDIRIPGVDGVTLYRELKEKKSPNLEKFIFITGDAISSDIQEFLESAKRPFLSKPFDLQDIKKTIRQLMNEKAILHQRGGILEGEHPCL